MTVTRRQLLATAGAGVAASLIPTAAANAAALPNAVLCTDYAVDPHGDPDDAYDVACAKQLGIRKVVLDRPTARAEAKLAELGMYAVDEVAIGNADTVAVVGTCTKAARNYRWGQRVVVFAGRFASPEWEPNRDDDIDAFNYLTAAHNTFWVPCFQGDGWSSGANASWAVTTDDYLTTGTPVRGWLRSQFADMWGARNLWAGALLNFAFMNTWAGHTVATPGRTFTAGGNYAAQVAHGTRWLLERA